MATLGGSKSSRFPQPSLPIPFGSRVALPTHAPPVLGSVGVDCIKGVPVFAMRLINWSMARTANVLRKRGRRVKVGRLNASPMSTGHSTIANWICVVAKMIHGSTLGNRPNPMLVRPSVGHDDFSVFARQAEFPIAVRIDVSLPLKAPIVGTFGFSQEANLGIDTDGAFVNTFSCSSSKPTAVMSAAPSPSNGHFVATFYGADIHRTSIPNRLNIGG